MNVVEYSSPGGRPLSAFGPVEVLTEHRLVEIGGRFDSDPRVASVGVVPIEADSARFASATRPAGVAVVFARDLDEIVGIEVDAEDIDRFVQWSEAVGQRGFRHEWWLHPAQDVQQQPMIVEQSSVDSREREDISSSLADSMPVHADTVSIAVDATWLGPYQTGAQVLTTEAVRALASRDDVTRLVMSGLDELPDYAAHLATLEKVEVTADTHDPTDVYWFPNQWDHRNSPERIAARRVITTYLDFIAYGIDSYHGSEQEWLSYRALQRSVALASDGVTTISADVAQQLMDNVPLMDPVRVRALPLGIDHVVPEGVRSERPESLPPQTRPFVLVLGNDFRHKNRDFAIKVWSALLEQGVSCDLVLAGLHVRGSSSRHAEQELLSGHVNLRGDVHLLDHVDESSRLWLLENAAAVLYPTSAEGFGFVPFEAAMLGTATSFVSFGSLRELASASGLPVSWSVDAFTLDLQKLLTDTRFADNRVAQILSSGNSLRWDAFAQGFVNFSKSILALPRSAGLPAIEHWTSQANATRARSRRSVSGVYRRIRRWNQ